MEESRGFNSKDAAGKGRKRSLLIITAFVLALLASQIAEGMVDRKLAFPLLSIVGSAALWGTILLLWIPSFLDERQLLRLMRWTMGPIEHVQISSPVLELKIRQRYQPQIRQLEFLGFDYQFADGETFRLSRLVLVFPALVALMMRSKNEVMAIHRGRSILTGHPIFASRDKSTFGHPNGLGTIFETAFHDGAILVTKNYGDSTGYVPTAVVQSVSESTQVGDLWAAHQRRVAELEAEGKRVDNPISFEAYADVSHRENNA